MTDLVVETDIAKRKSHVTLPFSEPLYRKISINHEERFSKLAMRLT
jgi:hypothetical protein